MTAEEEARSLIDAGYQQVSRKYGHLARLPAGVNGRTALYVAAMRQYRGLPNEEFWIQEMRRWVDSMDLDACTGQYLRVYAPPVQTRTVTKEVMDWFHRLGGKVAR